MTYSCHHDSPEEVAQPPFSAGLHRLLQAETKCPPRRPPRSFRQPVPTSPPLSLAKFVANFGCLTFPAQRQSKHPTVVSFSADGRLGQYAYANRKHRPRLLQSEQAVSSSRRDDISEIGPLKYRNMGLEGRTCCYSVLDNSQYPRAAVRIGPQHVGCKRSSRHKYWPGIQRSRRVIPGGEPPYIAQVLSWRTRVIRDGRAGSQRHGRHDSGRACKSLLF